MAKGKNRKSQNRDESSNKNSNNKHDSGITTSKEPIVQSSRRSLYQWCLQEREGILWVLGCAFVGGLFGFGLGSGIFTGDARMPQPSAWRVALGMKIRSTSAYRVITYGQGTLYGLFENSLGSRFSSQSASESQELRNDPSHPMIYAVLREAVVREKGGFVHPDLGILTPAPCGAARGLGFVRFFFHHCQTRCMPGIASEKLSYKNNITITHTDFYRQEEVLIKVPLGFQMTRAVALETLLPRISPEVQRKSNIHELDDAALLVLLLAHERGVGQYSRWLPYIASLPLEPSCGYSRNLRPYMLDSINALRDELGLDVNGWPGELLKATQYAERIAKSLAKDYGSFLSHPKGVSAVENIAWALCQVASRGTAGSQKHGALRMVPIMDMINHDSSAGGFVELTGKERLEDGDFVDAMEEDSGAFVVRSLRHGRRRALKPMQELLVNYNVPHYSPLDWLVSLGFVPPERWTKWQKIDAALPKVRRDGLFGASDDGSDGPGWQAAGGGSSSYSSRSEL